MVLTLARVPNKHRYSINASRLKINTHSTGISGSNNSDTLL